MSVARPQRWSNFILKGYSQRKNLNWQDETLTALAHLFNKGARMVFLTRRATFSASHFYWNEAWTAEKNEQVFGRCANRNGHGHNYTLEVTVAGEPDAVTGFVVDLKWLKDVMEREVLGAYDHRHLNLEVAEFAEGKLIPTSENIAIAAWKRLEPAVTAAGGAQLSRVRVYETAEIFAEYRGGR